MRKDKDFATIDLGDGYTMKMVPNPLFDASPEQGVDKATGIKKPLATATYGVTLDEIMEKQDGKEVANG